MRWPYDKTPYQFAGGTVPTVAIEGTARHFLEAGQEALVQACFCTGDFAEARGLLQGALERARVESDLNHEAAAYDGLGLLLHYENITQMMSGNEVDITDVDAEEALFRRALDIRQALGDRAGVAPSLFGLGLVCQVLRHDWASAMLYFRQCAELVDALTDGIDLYTRSEIHRHLGFYFLVEDVRPHEAVRHLQQSLDLREQLGDPRRIPSALVALGQAEADAGNAPRAVELLKRAVTEARAAGLLQQWIEDAEQSLHEAEAALAQN
jgi:tetratricopeptide (TPR) repeat protein